MCKNFLFSPVLRVDQGMLPDGLFGAIHTDMGVTESKLALLTTRQVNGSGAQRRGVEAKECDFIQRAD